MPRRTLWILLAAIVVSLACYERADRNPYGRWFSEAMAMIDSHYVEAVDDEKLFQGALDGAVGKLDEYSAFFPRSESKEFHESLEQQYGGIGIEVTFDGPDKQLTVASPIAGTPAYKAGMRAGDEIVTIDGRNTSKLPLREIVHLLRGKPGSTVVLGVHREHESPLEFRLVRAVIKTDSVLGDVREPDGKWYFLLPGNERIGYVRITTFGESTVHEFEAALKWLADRNCRGLILDLRNNPGGLLQSAERICDLFVPKDALIVTTRGRDAQERERFVADGKGTYQDLPLVVLVNDRSASASEIVAACLQDHKRASIVGERTWGKGTVQNVIPLEGGKSSLKLTVATYWRPSGQNIHRTSASTETDPWGVTPDEDCNVKLDEKQLADLVEKRRQRDVLPAAGTNQAGGDPPTKQSCESPAEFDPQLKRAIEALKEEIGGQHQKAALSPVTGAGPRQR